MKIKKAIKEWILPPGFLKLRRYLKESVRSGFPGDDGNPKKYSLPNQQNDLRSFKEKYNGQRCFVLATGPSIQKQDLRVLKGEKCIGVSMFHLHEHIDIIKPIWHVLAPPHPPFKFDTVKKIIDSSWERYKDFNEINFMLGSFEYEYSYLNYLTTQQNEFLKRFRDSVYFINYNKAKVLSEKNFDREEMWNIEENPFLLRTVIYSAIQLANYLGFKEIILLGCDHDYLYDINRIENHHFYSEEQGFSDRENLSAFDRERWFFEYYNRWKDYRLMRRYLALKGVKIINATEGGMLDVFPRRNLEDFFH